MDHLDDPQAVSWTDLKQELRLTDDERRQVVAAKDEFIAQARAYRLAEIRRRQHATQTDIAKAMGVTQARVSRIEKGELTRSEVDTLAAYVRALGGRLKIVAEFGDESYVLG
ncbi:Helix-turn-helix domain-containing protein [Asanoa hainanensis]|uniref:Helix-turn-helix domain-containing protein n=1 Tax=Asanoa hainanensis TaxID=560556 RepID=A0A239MBR0_9ACTN|nr:XRE family transcriptional regulator [Asanoa hainanensis]SNT39602.1 Helix-turn-helix domain-containing protein [Asanoa hainanensis]